ncbi:MAG: response regulator [Desulfobacula sp.]|jgi:DNA-binding NtrC family response regulator
MKIFIVDDEGIVLESCRRVLESEGYEVDSADGVDAAIKAIDPKNTDLLLIDIKMPLHDGLYLINELKKQGKTVPAILMSGLNTPETIAEAQKTGACRFLAKPFTPDELLDAVHQVIPYVLDQEKCHGKEKSTGNRR